MPSTNFFEESREQSAVKSAIVSKYFDAWARVMVGAQRKHGHRKDQRIAYIDLFCGPGRFKDGTVSTPLLVLQKAIADPELSSKLVTIFNDKDERCTRDLSQAIRELPGIGSLKHPPIVFSEEVGEEMVERFRAARLVPTLFFIDPFGYKGLSLQLIQSVVKDWGCDCILFFNYNRINMGLANPFVEPHINALFGSSQADHLRGVLRDLAPEDREGTVVEALCSSLRLLGPRFVLPFRFRDAQGARTSHHLLFVSKNFKGYEIMKDIMARESTAMERDVPSLEYNPVEARMEKTQPLLFRLSRPLDGLCHGLLRYFGGRTITMEQIYQEHSVDRPFTKRHYKAALRDLDEQGLVKASPHKRGTLPDKTVITFPPIV